MREINHSEITLLKQIAYLHESIPTYYNEAYHFTSLDVELRYESIQLLMKHRNDRIVVIEDGQLCAFIWFNLNEYAHIKSTFVSMNYRHQGYATQLKQYVASLARQHGITMIQCDVDPNNIPMYKLNHKLGYQRALNGNKMIKILEV
ncbi:GNAT family N-acetyltransferase [Macrococcus capreoli]|uniref:GNAT family N-acetyltransferase n=1 Tax=Macrococcus capreoli TaxID=2982690 RepID=UPI0021D5744D|nr:GNAT family N-acetyltransferase [Macrococcus sp. TMW 2.2395]MCU7556227.1 GNAT family N-acetyltransferase [Macrococcus sp. TMW 2.2395]